MEIAPGQRRDLAVEFVAALDGEFEYPLTLYYEQDGLRSLTIPIRGVVRNREAGTDARVRNVAELRQGESRFEDVTVLPDVSGKIAHWRSSCECVKIQPRTLEVVASIAAKLRVNIDMSKDDFVGELGVLCEGLDDSGRVLVEFELRFDVVR